MLNKSFTFAILTTMLGILIIPIRFIPDWESFQLTLSFLFFCVAVLLSLAHSYHLHTLKHSSIRYFSTCVLLTSVITVSFFVTIIFSKEELFLADLTKKWRNSPTIACEPKRTSLVGDG